MQSRSYPSVFRDVSPSVVELRFLSFHQGLEIIPEPLLQSLGCKTLICVAERPIQEPPGAFFSFMVNSLLSFLGGRRTEGLGRGRRVQGCFFSPDTDYNKL